MIFEGTLEYGELVPTLRCISALRQSGLLSVQGEPDLISVTFLEGAVVAADAMNRPAEEVLGEVLARRGLLSPSMYAEAVTPFMGSGKLATELLGDTGLVAITDLLEAVREQVYSQLTRLLRWESGNFNWTPNVESPFEPGIIPISVPELLVRAASDLGVEGPLRAAVPQLDDVYRASDQLPKPVKVLGRDGDWILGGEDVIWLTPDELQVWEQLAGQPAAGGSLAVSTDLGEFAVQYALYELGQQGLCAAVGAAPSQSQDEGGELSLDSSFDAAAALDAESEPPRAPEPSSPFAVGPALVEYELDAPSDPDSGQLHLDEELLDGSDAGFTGGKQRFDELPPEPTVADGIQEETGFESFSDQPPPRQRRSLEIQRSATLISRGLGVGLALLLAAVIGLRAQRSTVLFPYPWQPADRGQFQASQQGALYHKIDQAIRAYALLYGREPEELGLLVDLRLLGAHDLYDAEGRWLAYSVDDEAYSLEPVDSGGPRGVGSRIELRSDFFLNPQFVELPAPSAHPVVLLD